MPRIKLTASALAMALALAAQAPVTAYAQDAVASTAHSLAPADLDFVLKAANDSMAEAALGKLAQEKAGSDKVKEFGQKMVQDHEQANQELAQIVEPRGTRLPQQPSDAAQEVEKTLAVHSGQDFDRAYMAHQVAAHDVALTLFRHAAEHGQTPAVRDYAAKHAPVIEEHLETARSIQDEVENRS